MSDNLHQTEAFQRLRQLSEPSEQVKLQSDEELLSLYLEGGSRDAMERPFCICKNRYP